MSRRHPTPPVGSLLRGRSLVKETPCPFCRGKFAILEHATTGQPFGMHTAPACAPFLTTASITDYLRAVNDRMEATRRRN